jgi:hypothetical protein
VHAANITGILKPRSKRCIAPANASIGLTRGFFPCAAHQVRPKAKHCVARLMHQVKIRAKTAHGDDPLQAWTADINYIPTEALADALDNGLVEMQYRERLLLHRDSGLSARLR